MLVCLSKNLSAKAGGRFRIAPFTRHQASVFFSFELFEVLLQPRHKMSDALLKELHKKFVLKLHRGLTKDTFEYWVTEHLRMSATYWGLMALVIIHEEQTSDLEWNQILEWVCF